MSELKVTRTVVVTDPAGIHARTALDIAKIVRKYSSKVILNKDYQQADGTEVLQILTLLMECGSRVTLEATGPDAEDVLDAIEPLFAGQTPR
jgi:phosphocarrier protein HPr